MNKQTDNMRARRGQRSEIRYMVKQTCLQQEQEHKAGRWSKM